jgi:hypothetical protein
VAFCLAYVDNCCPGYIVAEVDLNRVEALLLQVATLRTYSLQSQVQTHTGIKDGLFEAQDRDFPHIFCTTTQEELEISSESKEQQGCGFFSILLTDESSSFFSNQPEMMRGLSWNPSAWAYSTCGNGQRTEP